MEVKIEIIENDGNFVSEIFINNKWFKEVGGVSNINDLMIAITDSLNNDKDFIWKK